jgi:hypothetical protein
MEKTKRRMRCPPLARGSPGPAGNAEGKRTAAVAGLELGEDFTLAGEIAINNHFRYFHNLMALEERRGPAVPL